jgi:hypothetical protein
LDTPWQAEQQDRLAVAQRVEQKPQLGAPAHHVYVDLRGHLGAHVY